MALDGPCRYTVETRGTQVSDTPTEREGESVWTRLRRRRVVQWGVAYAASAWVLLQVLGFVSDAFAWSPIVKQSATLVLAIGLPIVLVVGWYHGERGQQRVSGPELALLTLLLLIGGGLLWFYAHRREATTPTIATSRPTSTAAVTDTRPSIAVLPFDNRSKLEDDAYFVDGIHDDILTQLSKVSALRVISRTSVEQFREAKLPLRAIADQLGVTKILEGGVQRGGDRVRINVQLIDAHTDAHLWAESYDRELTADNIFAIQSEIASSISQALRTTLTPLEHERMTSIPTRDLDAWKDYQLGRRRLEQRNSAALAEAEAFFQKAIDQDPDFALAYVGLGETLRVQLAYSAVPRREVMARADAVLASALVLDANLGAAHASAAGLAGERREFARAEAGFRRAIELDPNYATAHMWYGFLLTRLGRFAEALQQMEMATELDPLSSRAQSFVAQMLGNLGRFEEALQRLDRAIEIDPSVAVSYSTRGLILAQGLNRWADAIPWWEQARQRDPGSPNYLNRLALGLSELRLDSDAMLLSGQALGLGVETVDTSRTAALIHVYRGALTQSTEAAERALAQRSIDTVALRLLRDVDLRAGRPDRARQRYAAAYPELVSDKMPPLDVDSFFAAIDLAMVLQQTGESVRADVLLDRSREFLRSLGTGGGVVGGFEFFEQGYAVADARIAALRGQAAESLAALRQAERKGWRAGWRYYRDHDPVFATIRGSPEFKAVFADIERDMAQQRARLAARPKDAPLDLTGTTH